MASPRPGADPLPGPLAEIIAHRGYSAAAPENTMAALEAAMDAGAHALECDVRMAGDGTAVLFHDATLERTTDGTGPLDGRSAPELARLDAGGWFSLEFRNEPVPTLARALDLVASGEQHLYPEIKAYHDGDELHRMVELVRDRGLLSRTTFISMEWEALEIVRSSESGALIGYIVEKPRRFFPALERAQDDPAAILDLDYRIVLADPALAREARDRGVDMAVWTVDDTEDARRLLNHGVSRLTTNQVGRLLAWSRSTVR